MSDSDVNRKKSRVFFLVGFTLCLIGPLMVSIVIFYLLPVRFEELGVEIALRLINVFKSALLLAAVVAGLSIAIHKVAVRLRPDAESTGIPHTRLLWLAEIVSFFAVTIIISYCLNIPDPVVFTIIVSAVFAINFPLGQHLKIRRSVFVSPIAISHLFCIFLFWTLLYIEHKREGIVCCGDCNVTLLYYFFLTWWLVFTLLISGVGPFFIASRFGQAYRTTVSTGRLITCFISIPLLSLGFFSTTPIPLSPQASLILPVENLYDVDIDRVGERVLATQTQEVLCTWPDYCSLFVIEMNDLSAPPKKIRVPTVELEHIIVHDENREIYHANRVDDHDLSSMPPWERDETEGTYVILLVMDADTFTIKRQTRIYEYCDGSIQLALGKASNQLYLTCEENVEGNLITVDLKTLEVIAKTYQGGIGGDIVADPNRDVLYVNYEMRPYVQALDAKTLEVLHRSKGPYYCTSYYLSDRRQELYICDPLKSKIYVYSTPDLELLHRIPTQFGGRALAVDEDHNLLIAGSYLTGYVDVIDLVTNETIQHHYVGKAGRLMAVDPSRRHAFMSTPEKGLFVLKY